MMHPILFHLFRSVYSKLISFRIHLRSTILFLRLFKLRYSLFQMVMCIPLICISNLRELVKLINVQQITHVIFCKLLLGGGGGRGGYFR